MTPPREAGGVFPFLAKGDFKGLVLFTIASKPMHGYEVMKSIEDRFHGIYKPSPGVIYPALRALRRLKYVRLEGAERRKVYRITASGKAYLRDRRAEMEKTYRAFESAVGPERAALLRDFRRTAQLLMPNLRNITPAQAGELGQALAELRERIVKVLAG